MARDGFPEDPDNYSEGDPTQYANYGGTGGHAYSEYGEPGYDQLPADQYGRYPGAEPPPSWHHRPAVLIGLGVLTAALLALLFYAIVSFTNAGSSTKPAVTSTSTSAGTSSAPSTSAAPPPPGPTTQTAAPAPSSSEAPRPTVTTTVTTVTPATSEAPAPTTVTSVTTSVTTVTETTTKPRWPPILRPTPQESPAPAPGG